MQWHAEDTRTLENHKEWDRGGQRPRDDNECARQLDGQELATASIEDAVFLIIVVIQRVRVLLCGEKTHSEQAKQPTCTMHLSGSRTFGLHLYGFERQILGRMVIRLASELRLGEAGDQYRNSVEGVVDTELAHEARCAMVDQRGHEANDDCRIGLTSCAARSDGHESTKDRVARVAQIPDPRASELRWQHALEVEPGDAGGRGRERCRDS